MLDYNNNLYLTLLSISWMTCVLGTRGNAGLSAGVSAQHGPLSSVQQRSAANPNFSSWSVVHGP